MVRCVRKVIRIRGEDSPNVRRALWQLSQGLEPDGEQVVPGVLTWGEYCLRTGRSEATGLVRPEPNGAWDAVRRCIGIDAQFYEGAELLLFPPEWLNRAEQAARELTGRTRKARAIGVDPAEGGDQTAMAAVDEHGLIELVSRRTPNTDDIPREALAFIRKHGVVPERVAFDRGGGGKQHADRLTAMGCPVRTVAFGESLILMPRRGMTMVEDKIDNREERYAYVNRRAQMYHELSLLLDPGCGPSSFPELVPYLKGVRGGDGFAIPAAYQLLRSELAPVPKEYDPEGRLKLRSKHRQPGQEENKHKTLVELIGHSPDQADALALACHAMLHRAKRVVAGAAV